MPVLYPCYHGFQGELPYFWSFPWIHPEVTSLLHSQGRAEPRQVTVPTTPPASRQRIAFRPYYGNHKHVTLMLIIQLYHHPLFSGSPDPASAFGTSPYNFWQRFGYASILNASTVYWMMSWHGDYPICTRIIYMPYRKQYSVSRQGELNP